MSGLFASIAKAAAVVVLEETAKHLRESAATEKPGMPVIPMRPRPDATRQTVRFRDIYPDEQPRGQAQKEWL